MSSNDSSAAVNFAGGAPKSTLDELGETMTNPTPMEYSRAAWSPVLRKAFLTIFANDFFVLYEACLGLDPQNPVDALKCAGVTLLGPFKWMAGTLTTASHQTDRGAHHPPEFQPLLSFLDDSTRLTQVFGYWRDDPNLLPHLVVGDMPLKERGKKHPGPGLSFKIIADNLIAALYWHIGKVCSTSSSAELSRVKSTLAEAARHNLLSLDALSDRFPAAIERQKMIVAPTSSGMGIVVPYDRQSEIGYRKLHLSGKPLRQLLDRIVGSDPGERSQHQAELDDLINWSNIANDESDFGAGLQLGQDLLNHDVAFAKHALQQLRTAYLLLGRRAFATISEEHAKTRLG